MTQNQQAGSWWMGDAGDREADRRIRALLKKQHGGRLRIGDFRHFFPELSWQIAQDSGHAWLDLWGCSYNRDEYTAQTIVDRKILNCIGRLNRSSIRLGRAYHAGFLHTYGYCLSLIETRFGRKRDRWTKGQVARLLSLDDGLLRPIPPAGTLLQNLTGALLAAVRPYGFCPARQPERLSVPFEGISFQASRMIESVPMPGAPMAVRLVTLIGRERRSCDPDLLCIYWVDDLATNTSRLVTCFPMSPQSAAEYLAMPVGKDVAIRMRFNAAVDGWERERTFVGERRVESPSVP